MSSPGAGKQAYGLEVSVKWAYECEAMTSSWEPPPLGLPLWEKSSVGGRVHQRVSHSTRAIREDLRKKVLFEMGLCREAPFQKVCREPFRSGRKVEEEK